MHASLEAVQAPREIEQHEVRLHLRRLLPAVERLLQPTCGDFREQPVRSHHLDLREGAERLSKLVSQGTRQLFLKERRQRPVVRDVEDDLELVGLLQLGVECSLRPGASREQDEQTQADG